MEEFATYVLPYGQGRVKVKVLGRAVRNGQKKVHIELLDYDWDLWVPGAEGRGMKIYTSGERVLSGFLVNANEFGTGMLFTHEACGSILLSTERVHMDTLMRLADEHVCAHTEQKTGWLWCAGCFHRIPLDRAQKPSDHAEGCPTGQNGAPNYG